ncbi:MAG: hypothetical protein DMF96_09330 [Acidobacteria bacterium]|nr:MAG: hypothetical protein DMF96_09330 [Acidobacteriota bacterium]
MAVRSGDERVQRSRVGRIGGERRRAGRAPERGKGSRVVDRQIKIECEISTRVESAGVDDPQVQTIEEQTPRSRSPPRLRDREPPKRIQRLAPRCDQQRHVVSAGPKSGCQRRVRRFDLPRWFESKRGKEWRGGGLKESSRRRCGAEHRAAGPPCDQIAAGALDIRRVDRRQLTFDEHTGDQMTVDAGQHG